MENIWNLKNCVDKWCQEKVGHFEFSLQGENDDEILLFLALRCHVSQRAAPVSEARLALPLVVVVRSWWDRKEFELTDEAEDVPDGRNEDNQHVVEGQDGSSYQQVASPAEVTAAEEQRGDGGADLKEAKPRMLN